MISRKLLTNLKLFVGEKYLRSRRAPRASTKTLKVKITPIYVQIVLISTKIYRKYMILRFSHFCFERLIEDLQKTLTNLKLFAGEKYLRSRRAPHASTKH